MSSHSVRMLQSLLQNGSTPITNSTLIEYTTPLSIATFAVSFVLRFSVIFACIVLLILCFLKRNAQPVSSRIFVPYVFLFSKILNNVFSIVSVYPSADLVTETQVSCYVTLWLTIPLYIISILCVAFLFVRFFMLRLYSNRRAETQELRRTTTSGSDSRLLRKQRIDRVLKFFMSPLFVLLEILVATLSLYVVGAIELILQKTKTGTNTCSDEWSNAGLVQAAILARYEIVLIVVITIATVTMVIADLVAQKLEKGKQTSFMSYIKNLFAESDPLRYRLELYCMAIPGLFLGLIFAIFGIVSYASQSVQPPYVNLIKSFLYVFFWEYPSLVVLPGIILFYAIKWERREAKSKIVSASKSHSQLEQFVDINIAEFEDSPGMIHRLLGVGDKQCIKLFTEFTKKEFSLENVLAYFDIFSYNAIPIDDQEARFRLWQLIYDSYLTTSSLNEINIPQRVVHNTKEIVTKYQSDPVTNPLPDDLFAAILDDVCIQRPLYRRIEETEFNEKFKFTKFAEEA